jgi:two-component system, NtrC family, sensor kinase
MQRHFRRLLLLPGAKVSLIRIKREQTQAAAAKIGQFIKEIESQLGWTTQLPWSAGSKLRRQFCCALTR